MDLRKAMRDPWVWGQLALLLLAGAAAPLVPRYIGLGELDPVLNRIDPDWIRWLGAIPIVAGIGFVVWGVRSLGPALTPGTEPLPGAPLVVTGAYAHSRHPIYLGIVLMVAGYVLAWSNWTLAVVLGFVALKFFERKARVEERWLLERHREYEAYMRHVGRQVL